MKIARQPATEAIEALIKTPHSGKSDADKTYTATADTSPIEDRKSLGRLLFVCFGFIIKIVCVCVCVLLYRTTLQI